MIEASNFNTLAPGLGPDQSPEHLPETTNHSAESVSRAFVPGIGATPGADSSDPVQGVADDTSADVRAPATAPSIGTISTAAPVVVLAEAASAEADADSQPIQLSSASFNIGALASVTTAAAISGPGIAMTGTGLDLLVDIILTDAKLAQGTSQADIEGGASAASQMNVLIVEGIIATRIADDGVFDGDDVVALHSYLNDTYYDEWVVLHGDDENGIETGFHLVQGDGNATLLYGSNAVNKVADGIYHLGFDMLGRSRLSNEDGNANASIHEVADWLNSLLADDLANGCLDSGIVGTDDLILTVSNGGEPMPFQDPYFTRYYDDDLSAGDETVEGGAGADVFRFQYNIMTTPDIAAQNADANGVIDWRSVAGENGATHDHWVSSGGDDTVLDYYAIEGDSIELVGHTVNFWMEHVDTDADGKDDSSVIHVYSDQGGYEVDADGNFTGSANGAHDGDSLGSITVQGTLLHVEDVSVTRNVFYGEYDTLGEIPVPDNIPEPEPMPDPSADIFYTGTGLDQLVDIILTDSKLAQGTSQADIEGGASSASQMNVLIVEAIFTTGVADDGVFDGDDVVALHSYLNDTYYDEWVVLHGDDENGIETGFHLVQGDGNATLLYGSNAVNKVADGIYHLGFDMLGRSRLSNEDGDGNASIHQVADWLNELMADDLANGSLHSDMFM